jgi:hypothetical protein
MEGGGGTGTHHNQKFNIFMKVKVLICEQSIPYRPDQT